MGTTGLLSLGHTVYFGIGSYARAFPDRFANLESVKIHLLVGVLSATMLRVAFGFLCTTATRILFTILSLALV